MGDVAVSGTGLVRWSRIKARLTEAGVNDLVEDISKALEQEDLTCDEHGDIKDPLIFLNGKERTMSWSCPYCATGLVRALWEAQGEEKQDG